MSSSNWSRSEGLGGEEGFRLGNGAGELGGSRMTLLDRAKTRGTCPSRQELIDFGLGRLPEEGLEAVALHLSSCDRCEALLDELHRLPSDDVVLAEVRECLQAPPPVVGPACELMAAMAQALLAEETIPDHEARRAGDDGGSGLASKWIGQYRVVGKIGHGGMGVVYGALQVPLNRMVALKMILAGPHAGPEVVTRFRREGKAIARLRHPNVVQVYDLGEHEGLPYFSMELLGGGNLQARLADGPLPPQEAAGLVLALAQAVEYAHGEGVVHRDLKPANILIDLDGTPKIADFGLAKLLDEEPGATGSLELTESGTVLGTPSYMAPEQAAGRVDLVGTATDIHALGAILYAALTGRAPYVGDSKPEVLRRVLAELPVRPSRLRGEVPYWLESICLKCLEKSPGRRYASAGALAADLRSWLSEERPRGAPGRVARLGRRMHRNLATIALGLAVLAIGSSKYFEDPDRAARHIQSDLARGRAVTLIGASGKPRWSAWRLGSSSSQVRLADDGAFAVTSWGVGLLELLPDPKPKRYRFAAQVRHETSQVFADTGIYFARKGYRGKTRDLQFFTQLSFNGVNGNAERLARWPAGFKIPPTLDGTRGNRARLLPRLCSDWAVVPHEDLRFPYATGPLFQPLGPFNGRWHDLEVIVTPERLLARWDGQSFAMETAKAREDVAEFLRVRTAHRDDLLPRGPLPAFDNNGGLGLYVSRGFASFRNVTVTPL